MTTDTFCSFAGALADSAGAGADADADADVDVDADGPELLLLEEEPLEHALTVLIAAMAASAGTIARRSPPNPRPLAVRAALRSVLLDRVIFMI